MITLSQAFKLFDWVKNPTYVYLRFHKSSWHEAIGFSTQDLIKYADLNKIKVYNISNHFVFDYDCKLELTTNISYEKLYQLDKKIFHKKYKI